MRQRLLRLSGLLAAVLLLQWAVGLAGCIASAAASSNLDLAICHADHGSAPRPPDNPAGGHPAASVCPLCVQLSTTVLPPPPVGLPGPTLIHVATFLPDALYGIVPARFFPTHLARGPPGFS